MSICNRCSGKGIINVYRHIQNGQCFACGGSGHFGCKPIHRTTKPKTVTKKEALEVLRKSWGLKLNKKTRFTNRNR